MRMIHGVRKAVTGLALVAAAGCGSNSPTEPGGVAAELRAVRNATWGFHDFTQAMAAGYASPVGGHCDQSPAGVPGMPWHYDLHMWAFSENPSGRFAQWNPSLSCAM